MLQKELAVGHDGAKVHNPGMSGDAEEQGTSVLSDGAEARSDFWPNGGIGDEMNFTYSKPNIPEAAGQAKWRDKSQICLLRFIIRNLKLVVILPPGCHVV
jgi:hypothetical protein